MLLVYKLNPNAIIPKYATSRSACFDLHACLVKDERVKYIDSLNVLTEGQLFSDTLILHPGCRALIPTGLKFNIPPGYSVRLHPRSGLSFKSGLTLSNCEGVIDEDYREEIFISMHNISYCNVAIKHGDRVCQAELTKDYKIPIVEVLEDISRTGDRIGGFGSTGK
ncbi:Dut dUTPase [uncultured Caudovirales phage]|uniref:dUTP diphosphatase n=1 Tax=uncultured Caudovirales phage TaxID=2100421 RepID=A0A6J5M2Q1_9CAUD|nr:Dut dUTPase [uncultured Caudovirales phage]